MGWLTLLKEGDGSIAKNAKGPKDAKYNQYLLCALCSLSVLCDTPVSLKYPKNRSPFEF
jgi:hypothetical protein